MLLAALALIVIPTRYEVSMTITSVGDNPGNNGGMLSALTALKQSPDEEHFQQLQLLMISNKLSEALMNQSYILEHIFKKDWDEKTKTWREPDDVISIVTRFAGRLLGAPPWSAPSPARIHRFLKSHIVISADRQTGFVAISYADTDARFAINFINLIYQQSDDILRLAERKNLDKQIAYMRARIDQVTVDNYRQQLLTILSSLERQRMIVGSDTPFAAKILNSAILPNEPSFPIVWEFLLAGFFAGMLISGTIVFYSSKQRSIGDLIGWFPGMSRKARIAGPKWVARPQEKNL